MVKKIPKPGFPPIVIALIPTDGKDDADCIHGMHVRILQMAETLELKILVFAADGAAPELAAQSKMDESKSDCDSLVYAYPLYGISLRAPVFKKTGPLISVTDPPHARKTCRNQPQYGTHTASMGIGYLVNRSLVDLYQIPDSGLVRRDVEDVDKQDDGAARRLFHIKALTAATVEDGGVRKVRDGFIGLFVYLFIFGWFIPSTLGCYSLA
jgi:hypothetical protein